MSSKTEHSEKQKALVEKGLFCAHAERSCALSGINGSPGRARTSDPMINSHLLYQLSYRGTADESVVPPAFKVNVGASNFRVNRRFVVQ